MSTLTEDEKGTVENARIGASNEVAALIAIIDRLTDPSRRRDVVRYPDGDLTKPVPA